MVLRYFRKPTNPPPQDSKPLKEVDPQLRQDDSNVSPKEGPASNDAPDHSDTFNSSDSEQHQTAGLSTAEASLVDATQQLERPILSEDDETFLKRAVSEEDTPELPPEPQIVAVSSDTTGLAESSKRTLFPGSSLANRWTEYKSARDRTNAADDLMSAAEGFKTANESQSDSDSEVKQESRDVNTVLRKLDLSAINNRVVGISNDTQKLLESFNQVLKDLINGVPTAYDDLESLLTSRQKQLDTLFGTLPPFLQKLVKSVPTKMYAYFAPQVAAAMTASKAAQKDDSVKNSTTEEPAEEEKSSKKKKLAYIPTLKQLVTKKGAVAAMLRSIISFLETRFPTLLIGTNVVMSMAVFVLLLVFWYCHKRGREVRLAKETESLEISTSDLEGSNMNEASAKADSAADESNNKLSEATDGEIERKVEQLAEDIEKRP